MAKINKGDIGDILLYEGSNETGFLLVVVVDVREGYPSSVKIINHENKEYVHSYDAVHTISNSTVDNRCTKISNKEYIKLSEAWGSSK